MKARGEKREWIVEWIGGVKKWRRSSDAPGIYTKRGAMRFVNRWNAEIFELRYRARKLTAKEARGHAK